MFTHGEALVSRVTSRVRPRSAGCRDCHAGAPATTASTSPPAAPRNSFARLFVQRRVAGGQSSTRSRRSTSPPVAGSGPFPLIHGGSPTQPDGTGRLGNGVRGQPRRTLGAQSHLGEVVRQPVRLRAQGSREPGRWQRDRDPDRRARGRVSARRAAGCRGLNREGSAPRSRIGCSPQTPFRRAAWAANS